MQGINSVELSISQDQVSYWSLVIEQHYHQVAVPKAVSLILSPDSIS